MNSLRPRASLSCCLERRIYACGTVTIPGKKCPREIHPSESHSHSQALHSIHDAPLHSIHDAPLHSYDAPLGGRCGSYVLELGDSRCEDRRGEEWGASHHGTPWQCMLCRCMHIRPSFMLYLPALPAGWASSCTSTQGCVVHHHCCVWKAQGLPQGATRGVPQGSSRQARDAMHVWSSRQAPHDVWSSRQARAAAPDEEKPRQHCTSLAMPHS